MDGQRFDRLAKELAIGSNRRGFLKRIAGIAAGAAAVAVPVKASATIEAYCSSDYECDSYNNEVCKYGKCVCDNGYKDCNGSCIPEYACCSDYDCGKNETCNDYGTCECPTYDGYKVCESDGACIPEYGCCGNYDCSKNEVCDYGTCTCPTYDGYKICESDGSCVTEYGCCGDYDCSYGETCEYGICTGEEKPEEEEPKGNPPTNGEQNYSKQLARTCNAKCVRAGRKSAKQKKQRLTSKRMRGVRNSCRRRCAANSR
jgi:hypothetical protein